MKPARGDQKVRHAAQPAAVIAGKRAAKRPEFGLGEQGVESGQLIGVVGEQPALDEAQRG